MDGAWRSSIKPQPIPHRAPELGWPWGEGQEWGLQPSPIPSLGTATFSQEKPLSLTSGKTRKLFCLPSPALALPKAQNGLTQAQARGLRVPAGVCEFLCSQGMLSGRRIILFCLSDRERHDQL